MFPRKHRMQSGQTCRSFLSRRLEPFRSVSEKYWKTIFLQKNLIFTKKLLWPEQCNFDQQAEKNAKRARNLSLKVRKRKQNKEVFKKVFDPKSSYEHVECSLDNPTGKFSTKGHESITQCPKLKQKVFQKNYLSWKASFGDLECSRENPDEKKLSEDQFLLFIVLNWINNFEKVSSNGLRWQIECKVDKLVEKFLPGSGTNFRSICENDRKNYFSKKIFTWKCSYGLEQCKCDNSARESSTEVVNVFLNVIER